MDGAARTPMPAPALPGLDGVTAEDRPVPALAEAPAFRLEAETDTRRAFQPALFSGGDK